MGRMEMSEEILLPRETWRILKNVIVISFAFMVQFVAYSGAANLQSSINAEAGLGMASLAAVYAGLIFSNIFLPVAVIKWLGTKWTMAVSFITYMPYIAAQLKPTFYTLIPAGLFVGFGGGPLWCAKCTYISVVSEAHNKISKIPTEALLVRFFGLFFMIFQMNQVWGNLISSLVISSADNLAAVTSVNASMIPEVCGANFLPNADAGEALPPQPPEKIQMLAGIYLACMAAAALIIAVGVDSMKRYDSSRKPAKTLSGFALLVVTLKLLVEPNQLLLVIINIFIGYQQAFFGADFTAAFVSCAVGTGSVGYVMMTYGLADAIGCILTGYLAKAFVSCAVGTGSVGYVMMTYGLADAIGCILTGYLAKLTGRLPLICVATLVHAGLFTTLVEWAPQAGSGLVLYVIAVLWGLTDSIWMVQINSYYGILFSGREEAAFSNFRLWESVGFIIAYIISPYLRMSTKTYLMAAMMVVGVMCYLVVEVRERRGKRTFEITKDSKNGCDNIAFQNVE